MPPTNIAPVRFATCTTAKRPPEPPRGQSRSLAAWSISPLLPAHYAPTVSPFCSLFHKVILLLLLIAMTLPHTQLPDSPRGSCSNVIDVTRTILSRAASTLSQGAKGKSSYTSTSIVAMSICSPSNASCEVIVIVIAVVNIYF